MHVLLRSSHGLWERDCAWGHITLNPKPLKSCTTVSYRWLVGVEAAEEGKARVQVLPQ